MLTYFLMAHVCTTAARDDCRPEYIAHFTGPSASLRCELELEAYLDGRRGLPPLRDSKLIKLKCEMEA